MSAFARPLSWTRIAALTGIVVFATAIVAWAVGERVLGVDFGVFHLAGDLFAGGDTDTLYDPTAFQDRLAADYYPAIGSDGRSLTYFISTPPFAAAMVPLSWLPFPAAAAVWYGLGALAAAAAVHLLGLPARSLVLVAVLPAVVYNTVLGQSGLLFLLLAVGVHRAAAADRRWVAGLLAGLFVLKPPLAIGLGLWWLLDARRWWRAIVGALGSAALVSIPTVIGGLGAWTGFVDVLTRRVDDEANWNVNSMSVAEFLKLLAPNEASLTLVFWSIALGAGALAMRAAIRRWPSDVELLSAAAMFVTVGASPHLSIYDTILLLVPAAVVLRRVDLDRVLAERLVAVYSLALAFAPGLYTWQHGIAGRGVGLELPALLVLGWLLVRAADAADAEPQGASVGDPMAQPVSR